MEITAYVVDEGTELRVLLHAERVDAGDGVTTAKGAVLDIMSPGTPRRQGVCSC